MKRNVLDMLWGIPLLLIGLFTVLVRPQVQSAEMIAPLCEMEGVQVYAGAPEEGEWVYYTRDQLLQGHLLLVSPENPLPDDFPAPNVRAVKTVVGDYVPAEQDAVLSRACIQALCDMRIHHPLDGFRILCGALSSAQQNALRRQVFAGLSQTYTLEKAAALSRQQVPSGGESEHQLGTAFDIQLTGPLEMGKSDLLTQSAEGVWLQENMWKYGFVRRYAAENAGQEQGHCENLHIRYVGKVHSAIMQCGGWTLETYLNVLRREGALTLCREGMEDAYVYCVPYEGSGGVSARLPHAGYACSLDNRGYAVFWAE